MSLTVTQSTQFTIEELILILPSNQKYDLTGVFTEINLFDNLFMDLFPNCDEPDVDMDDLQIEIE